MHESVCAYVVCAKHCEASYKLLRARSLDCTLLDHREGHKDNNNYNWCMGGQLMKMRDKSESTGPHVLHSKQQTYKPMINDSEFVFKKLLSFKQQFLHNFCLYNNNA